MTTALLVLLALSPVAGAQTPVPLGVELQVNSYTSDLQGAPVVATGGDGSFVITWHRQGQDPSSGVLSRRLRGGLRGEEFQVNAYTTDDQLHPAVAVDANGGFVVAWRSDLQDGSSASVQGQRFDADANRVGAEFQANSYTINFQGFPTVAADAGGDFVVAWQSSEQGNPGNSIWAQRFDSTGSFLGEEFRVNAVVDASQDRPAIATGALGGFVVVWQSSANIGDTNVGIRGQRFDSAGERVGAEIQVNTYTTGNQRDAAIAGDDDGGFVVVWASGGPNPQDGDGYSVHGQRFDSQGNPIGREFQANSHTTEDQQFATVATDHDGDFVVVWESFGQDGDRWSIQGQAFDSVGDPAGEEFQINSYTGDDQRVPSVAANGDGAFVVVWNNDGQSGNRIEAQRFAGADLLLFFDGFESGDASAW